MPLKSKKRRSSGKFYETVPNTKQAYLPAPRQTIREKPPTWSALPKYQQTITQMNPFYAIYHPESESDALQTDGEEEPSYVASPVGRKRRRIIAEEAAEPKEPFTRKMNTRSSARKAAKIEPQLQTKREEIELTNKRGNNKPSNPRPTATLMLPPVTPRTWRKREIPSSQSPADSPLSTQSRRSARGYSRSPLKERSTNDTLLALSTSKGVLWKRKLEVEDSMENEEENSLIFSRLRPNTEPVLPNNTPKGSAENDNSILATHEIATGWRSSGEVADSSQRRDSEANLSSPIEGAKVTKEIFDSDFAYDGEDTDNESIDLGQSSAPLPGELEMNAQISKNDAPNTASSPQKPPEGRGCSDNPPALNKSMEDDITTPCKQRSESEEASAQLFSDLQRATQPGDLQTESQYENAWHSYHPADTPNDNINDNEHLPSSPPLEAEEPYSMPAPMTIPTQILPPIATPFNRPIPPSQATTTDITQPSPRNMPSLSSLTFPSSPPPMPPPLSSPSESRKTGDPWMGFEWNGMRLTDSQLLPESLMNDSYLGPPGGSGMSQEDLEE